MSNILSVSEKSQNNDSKPNKKSLTSSKNLENSMNGISLIHGIPVITEEKKQSGNLSEKRIKV